MKINLIRKAEKFAERKHERQKRQFPPDEDYVNHPKRVAKAIKNLGLDDKYIIAALLHDVVEDTNTSVKEIEDEFGEDIAIIVDELTKKGNEEEYAKHFFDCDKNIALIKLIDFYDNCKQLPYLNKSYRTRYSYFANKYYLPLAKKINKDIYESIKMCFVNVPTLN